jgi:hypothetical protein
LKKNYAGGFSSRRWKLKLSLPLSYSFIFSVLPNSR